MGANIDGALEWIDEKKDAADKAVDDLPAEFFDGNAGMIGQRGKPAVIAPAAARLDFLAGNKREM